MYHISNNFLSLLMKPCKSGCRVADTNASGVWQVTMAEAGSEVWGELARGSLLIVLFIVVTQECDRCSLVYYLSRKKGKIKNFNINIPILKYGNYKFTLKRNLRTKIKIPTCGLNVALEH